MTRINLIPSAVLQRREMRQQIRGWFGRLVGCAVLLGVLYLGIIRVAAGPHAEVQQLSERVTQLQERFQGAENLIGERDRLARRREAIVSLGEAQPAGWYLELLGQALTRDAFLKQLTLQRCLTTPEGNKRRKQDCKPILNLHGFAAGHREVGDVLTALKNIGAFEHVELTGVNEQLREGSRRRVRFEMECRLAER